MKSAAWLVILSACARACACACAASCSGPVLTGVTGGADAGDAGSTEGAEGTMCTVPTASSGMLCEGLTTCPMLMVDQNAWHGCGFLLNGKVVALVCECSGYLCTAGSTPTCATASKLLSEGSARLTCNQLTSGGCVFEGLGGH